jgi:hypothetical protein
MQQPVPDVLIADHAIATARDGATRQPDIGAINSPSGAFGLEAPLTHDIAGTHDRDGLRRARRGRAPAFCR